MLNVSSRRWATGIEALGVYRAVMSFFCKSGVAVDIFRSLPLLRTPTNWPATTIIGARYTVLFVTKIPLTGVAWWYSLQLPRMSLIFRLVKTVPESYEGNFCMFWRGRGWLSPSWILLFRTCVFFIFLLYDDKVWFHEYISTPFKCLSHVLHVDASALFEFNHSLGTYFVRLDF